MQVLPKVTTYYDRANVVQMFTTVRLLPGEGIVKTYLCVSEVTPPPEPGSKLNFLNILSKGND